MEMNELDFSGRQVLVVGGSSGIGNGIAQAFRARGARVAVCGTRASASDYSPDDGSHLEGLDYFRLDVSDPASVEKFKPPFERLDVLVLAQGAVIYRRGEFEMKGFRAVSPAWRQPASGSRVAAATSAGCCSCGTWATARPASHDRLILRRKAVGASA